MRPQIILSRAQIDDEMVRIQPAAATCDWSVLARLHSPYAVASANSTRLPTRLSCSRIMPANACSPSASWHTR